MRLSMHWRALVGCAAAVGLCAAVSGCGRIAGGLGRAGSSGGRAVVKPAVGTFKPSLPPASVKVPVSHVPEFRPGGAGAGAGQGGHGVIGHFGSEGGQQAAETLLRGDDDRKKGSTPSLRPR